MLNLYREDMEHNIRVAILSTKIFKEKFNENLFVSALLHDIGKKYLDTSILHKKGKLNFDEFEHVKKHIEYSKIEVENMGFNIEIQANVLYHHENFNGTGYLGLKEYEIPLGARIIRILDMFDALTMDRPYRSKLSIKESLKIMEENKDNFDKKLFEEFKKYIKTIKSDTMSSFFIENRKIVV